MDKLFDILKMIGNRYPAFSRRLEEVEALARWEKAVGPGIAKHSRAIRVQDTVLWVEVDHPIWKSELHHRKRQILSILNQEPPTGAPNAKGTVQILSDIFLVDRMPSTRSRGSR